MPRAPVGGYCYFNNAAISAEWLVAQGAGRIGVLDVDYYHGNGTQQLFYDRADVAYASLHADPARMYPYFERTDGPIVVSLGLDTRPASAVRDRHRCGPAEPRGSGTGRPALGGGTGWRARIRT